MKRIALITAVIVLYAPLIFALPGTVQHQLTWNANTEADLASYSLYWRTPGGAFNNTNSVKGITATSRVITGVVPTGNEIALTAVDLSGNESAFSVIVVFDKDATACAAPSTPKIEKVP